MSASGPSGPLVLSSADFFRNQLFRKILSGIVLECQTVWIQIRPDIMAWVQTVCKGNQQMRQVGKELKFMQRQNFG